MAWGQDSEWLDLAGGSLADDIEAGTPTRRHGMPAEWAPHTRCWMAWPCRRRLWGDHLDSARRAYAEVARTIARFEPVTMIARPELTTQASLYCGPGISILPMAHDDSWTRDTGPVFVTIDDGSLAGVDWRFNGWGGLYADHADDAAMAARILAHLGMARIEGGMVSEGGAVHVDGEGTALACTASILDPARNPELPLEAAEAELRRRLGVEKVVWLPRGLVDDEGGGHVDNLACFARPGVVLAAASDDRSDPDYSTLAENLDVLRAASDARGRLLEVLTLPQPKPRPRHDGRRLVMSYVSFYLANGAVVMPGFEDAADKAAYRVLTAAFPDRSVVQIDALELLQGGGGIHGITLQQPAV